MSIMIGLIYKMEFPQIYCHQRFERDQYSLQHLPESEYPTCYFHGFKGLYENSGRIGNRI